MAYTAASNQYLADLLTSLGTGFLSAPRGGPPLAGLGIGLQTANQMAQQRQQQTQQDLRDQLLKSQIDQQQKAQADAEQQKIAAKSWLLGQSAPTNVGQGMRSAGATAPGAISSMPANMQPFLTGYAGVDPMGAMQMAGQLATQKPAAPTVNDGMQYNPATGGWDKIPGWLEQKKAIAEAGRAPIQPPQLSELQRRAYDAGLRPNTPEWKNFMLTGGVQPKVKTRPMTADEVKARGLDATGVYSIDADDNIHIDQKPKEPGGPFPGTSVDAGSLNIVTAGQGDPALREKPEYAAAWHQLYEQEQHQQIPDPNDPTGSTMVTISWMPKPPNGFIGPGSAAPAPVTASPSQTPQATPLPKGGAAMAAPMQTVPATDDRPAASVVPGTEARKARPVPPTGYQYDGAGNLGFIPGGPADPNTPTPEQRNKINEKLAGLDRLQSALDNYKGLITGLDNGGKPLLGKDGKPVKPVTPGIAGSVIGLPTENASQLGTAYTALAIEAKNLFELGALSGPDYGLIQQTLKDPNTTGGYMQDTGGRVKQIDEVQKILNNSRASWEKNYAPALRTAGSGGSDKAKIDELKNKFGITPVNP